MILDKACKLFPFKKHFMEHTDKSQNSVFYKCLQHIYARIDYKPKK